VGFFNDYRWNVITERVETTKVETNYTFSYYGCWNARFRLSFYLGWWAIMKNIKEKLSMSLGLLVMWPMLADSPKSKDKNIFQLMGGALKEIWFGKQVDKMVEDSKKL
jgi:hypothetical protein